MADEAGFELGRAFVSVDPDAADFDEKLAEQIGSPVVIVRVEPDMGDFDAKVDEEAGGHTATVRVDADTGPAREQVDELVSSGLPKDASFTVDADTGPARGALSELDGAADETREHLEKIQEGAAAAGQALGEVGGDAKGAAEELSASSAEVERFGEQFNAVSQEIREFGETAAGVGGSTEDLDAALGRISFALEGIHASGAVAVSELITLQGELTAVEGQLDTMEGAFGTAAGAIGDLGHAAVASAAETEGAFSGVAAEIDGITRSATTAAGQIDVLNGDLAAGGSRDLGGGYADLSQDLGRVSQTSEDALQAQRDLRAGVDEVGQAMTAQAREIGELDQGVVGSFEDWEEFKGKVSGLAYAFDDLNLSPTAQGLEDIKMQLADAGRALDGFQQDIPDAVQGLENLDQRASDGRFRYATQAWSDGAGDLEGLGQSAGDAAPQVEKLGQRSFYAGGALQGIAQSVGEFATSNPWAWAVGGAIVIGALGYALVDTETGIQGVINKMSDADTQTGYSVAGYQKLAHQMHLTDGIAGDMTHAIEGSVDGFQKARYGAESYDQAVGQVDAAHQKAIQEIHNLTGNLSELEDRYHGTQQQAYELIQATGGNVKAADRLGDALAKGGHAAEQAMHQIEDYGDANVGARGKVGEMSYDMSVFANDALTASQRIGALDLAFNSLVGNFVSSNQAKLQVEQGFLTLAQNVHTAGATMTGTNEASITLQQSFDQQIQTVEQAAQAMQSNGASVQQTTQYLQDQADKLGTFTGSSTYATQALQDFKLWEDHVHDSTAAATQALQRASDTLQDQFIVQVKNAGYASANTKGDVSNLATAIDNTGTQSNATADARAKLISQLEQSGMKASTAKTDVDHLIASLGKIPKQVAAHITVTGKGQWSVSESNIYPTPSGKAPPPPIGVIPPKAAAGMMVTGGTPGRDSVLISAMPGELVVPTGMVKAGAVDHLRGSIPGFAAGGVVSAAHVGGSYGGAVPGAGSWADTEDTATNQAVITSVEQAMGRAINSKIAGARASAGSGGRLHLSGSGASVEALMKSMAASIGWTGAQWQALYNVEMREAGFNLNAQNPGSGAYGLAQFIQGASEYAQYGGNSGTARGQITGMLQYIKDRYGTPSAAWQHELNYGWYDQGGMLQPGATLAQNNTGQPEMILPPSVTQALTSSTGPIAQLTQSLNNPAGGVNALDKALVNPGGPLAYLQRTIANPGGPMVQLGKAVTNPGGPMAKLGTTIADPGGPMVGLKTTIADPGGPMVQLANALKNFNPGGKEKSAGGSGVNPGGPEKSAKAKAKDPHMTGTPVYNINVNYNGTKPSAEDHQAAMLKLSAAIGVA